MGVARSVDGVSYKVREGQTLGVVKMHQVVGSP